jgi:glycosyltransferase involved in cell wall biosynthesis
MRIVGVSSQPLVSLVTPAYNQGAFLRQTILSVLSQDYRNIEYIIINDGSTDNTEEIITEFAGQVKVISRENRGQAATLNEGWSLCRGKYLGYLSSDDLLDSNAVSRLVESIESRPTAVVAYGDFRLIDANGKLIREVATEDYCITRLRQDLICQPGPGAIFNRDVIKQVGDWNENLRQVPDFEFWTRVSRVGDFVRVPGALASCRVHLNSASFRAIDYDRCEEILKVVDDLKYNFEGLNKDRALAKAKLVAGKRHYSSGRKLRGAELWLAAIILNPTLLKQSSFWRLIGSAMLRRIVYKRRASLL